MRSITCNNVQELDRISKVILEQYSDNRVFGIVGKMGAGKTTLIKAMCKELGVTDIVTSPTFSIINVYKTKTDSIVYHFDFYRLKNISELMDIGYEDYFYSGEHCLIEWPEKYEELLPENFVYIEIEVNDQDLSRRISF